MISHSDPRSVLEGAHLRFFMKIVECITQKNDRGRGSEGIYGFRKCVDVFSVLMVFVKSDECITQKNEQGGGEGSNLMNVFSVFNGFDENC